MIGFSNRFIFNWLAACSAWTVLLLWLAAGDAFAAQSLQQPLVVVDSQNRPIEGAVVYFGSLRHKVVTDKEGKISDPPRSGVRFPTLVVAHGFLPTLGERIHAQDYLVMRSDPQLQIRLRKANSEEPLANVFIRRKFPVNQHPNQQPRWLSQAVNAVLGTEYITSETGEVTIPSVYIHRETDDENGQIRLFGGILAVLEMAHPSGYQILVPGEEVVRWLPGEKLAPLEKQLEPLKTKTLSFVDARELPLRDRSVTLWMEGIPYSTYTDTLGKVVPSLVRQETSGVDAVEIDLGDGRHWRTEVPSKEISTFVFYKSDFRPIRGRINHLNPEIFSVASAHASIPQDVLEKRAALYPFDYDKLTWAKPDSEGSFALDRGWQGDRIFVLLRHEPSGMVADVVQIADNRVVVFAPPPSHKAHLSVELIDPLMDGMLELEALSSQFHYPERLAFPLQGIPSLVELPEGEYRVNVHTPSFSTTLGNHTVGQALQRLQWKIPKFRRVHGIVRGSLSGPIPQARLTALRADGEVVAEQWADLRGHFNLYLDAQDSMRVQARWPLKREAPWLDRSMVEQEITFGESEQVEMELAECLLEFEKPNVPTEDLIFRLTPWHTAGGGPIRDWRLYPFSKRFAEPIPLPPGKYEMSMELPGGTRMPPHRFEIEEAATETITVSDRLVRLSVVVRTGQAIEGRVWLTIRDEAGHRWFNNQPIWRKEPVDQFGLDGIEIYLLPGIYQMELEARFRDQRGKQGFASQKFKWEVEEMKEPEQNSTPLASQLMVRLSADGELEIETGREVQ